MAFIASWRPLVALLACGLAFPGAAGSYTHVVVNVRQDNAAIVATVYHELRHVALGEFGRLAAGAKHGAADVDTQTAAAEAEAKNNASSR